MLLNIAAVMAAADPASTTADLGFMVGEWQIEGAFNPRAANERTERGTQSCAFALGNAYVRCERKLTAADGKTREQVTFHNYNPLYGRFEHLFISSNWPTKVIGHSGLSRNEGRAGMTVEIAFQLPDGRTEQVRSVDRYDPASFESSEQMRVGEGNWRTSYRLVGRKVQR